MAFASQDAAQGLRKTHQGNNLKNDRTRASRKAARRYNVAPVARAVRSVLTLSAAALMFSGTGVVLAKSPVVAPLPVERASLSHEFAKVVDLTRVSDEWTPKSVVDEEFQSFAAPMGVVEPTMFAAGATLEGFGIVDDPTILPGSFHTGPGGVSGSDDAVFRNWDLSVPYNGPVNWNLTDGFVPTAQVSTTGIAVGAFISNDDSLHVSNDWDGTDVTGYTWAAGLEVESPGITGVENFDSITSTVTGADGVAFGVYAIGNAGAWIYNDGTLAVNGDGAGADAFGMYVFSSNGIAATRNFADMAVYADGDAVGSSAVSLGANAWNANSGTMIVSGYDAQGMYAASVAGDTFGQNTGTLSVSGFYATGIYALSINGTAHADNYANLDVYGAFAQGAWARSINGSAEASNSAAGVVNVDGYYGAAGLIANADNGTATVTNAGMVNVISSAGVARGAFAYGQTAVVTNSGTLTTGAAIQAIGIDAEGDRGATVTNSGTIVAGSSGDAIGVWATSNGDTRVVNDVSGNIDVDSVNGIAYGIYAGGYDAYVRNFANVDAASVYGDAIGIGVAGVYAFAQNDGTINANGGSAGIGMFGYGVVSANLDNDGSINATASATEGFAAGILAIGDSVGAINGGTIYASGAFATGIDMRGTSAGSVENYDDVIVRGGDVTGISVRASGQGGTANVLNYGVVDAQGDLFAVGIAAVARGYLGTASVYNGGNVTASAKYGAAQGIVASADTAASVDNQGVLHTYGGDSAYGILALSADGDVTVDNGNQIITAASNRGYGIAYGIAAQSNNGLVSITNDGLMITAGEDTAMGIYASTKWNDVEVTNNGALVSVAKYGAATGAIAITYTGDATVTNGEYGQVLASGAYSAGGLRAISLYGDAIVTNDGTVQTSAGALDRGLTARSLYGGTATITNNGTIETNGGYSSYGVWARSDYGDAMVHNTNSIKSTSTNGVAYGALAGGAYTISIDNSGEILAYATNGTAAGVLAYSLGGDASVTNSNYLLGVAGDKAYGAQVIANAGTASLTNTVDGRIVASGYNVADAVFASGAVVDVQNYGALTADADGWAAGVEAVGGDINLVSHTGADIVAYAYSGRATGLFANADGDATVRNGGSLDVDSFSGDAFGTFAQAGGNAILTNGGALTANSVQGDAFGMVGIGYNADLSQSGSITVGGYGTAVGIQGVGYAHANIVNNGDVGVTAVSGIAAGLYTYAVHDTRQVNNGTITAHAGSGRAFGMYAYGFDQTEVRNLKGHSIYASVDNGQAYGMFGYGEDALLVNDGAITATSGNGTAIGMLGVGYATSAVSNRATGSIVATAENAFGLVTNGDVATGTNGGDIAAHGGSNAIAMQGLGMYEGSTVSLTNSATATLYANVANKYGAAAGIVGNADGDVGITNGGTIAVRNGHYTYGVQGHSDSGNVSIHNAGDITSYASVFNGNAFGIDASGYGDVAVDSSGSIIATGKYATGISAFAQAGDVTVDNGGALTANALLRQGLGIVAIADAGDTTVGNTGTITINGAAPGAMVMGVVAGSYNGSATIHNDAGATVTTISQYGVAGGLYAFGPDVSIDNGGDVLVTGGLSAVGIGFDADHATVSNGGTITVSQLGGTPQAPTLEVTPGNGIGIAGHVAEGGSAVVTNDGAISVTALENAFGIQVDGSGDISVDSAGSIVVGGAFAAGIAALTDAGDLSIDNGGDVHVTGDAAAMGVGFDADHATIANSGTITVSQLGTAVQPLDVAAGNGIGIAGYVGAGGLATVTNDGAIDVAALDYAFGIQVGGYGDVVVDGAGAITVEGSTAVGIHVDALADVGATHVDVTTGAMLTAHGANAAMGVFAYGSTVSIQNTGTTEVFSNFDAIGLRGIGVDAVSIGNSGDLSVGAYGHDATGISALSGVSAAIANTGDVSVSIGEGGAGKAFGLHARSDGDTSVVNGGTVTVDATALPNDGTASGLYAFGYVTANLDNTGEVTVTAGADASGGSVFGIDATFHNAGGITATSLHGDATGVFANGETIGFGNAGDITAHGYGRAYGALVLGYGTVAVDNGGDITALAQGRANGLVVGGDSVTVANAGDIHAIAYQGAAAGAFAFSYGNLDFNNSGSITAQAAGDVIGLALEANGDATLANSGLLGAIHQDHAVALNLDVLGTATVNNIGDIVAQGSEEGSIAIQGGDGFDLVTNGGDIVGALVMGAGDDRLTNAAGGTWSVRGHATDFGDGDDAIVNAGTIVLHDAAISLGGNGTAGNSFTNNGLLSIAGDTAVDMGTGGMVALAAGNAPVSVLNPLAFTNNGTISFLDGAPDDMLTITGDFAGQGALNVDVSLLNGTSDMLYVDGNIVGNSVQTLNVNVLDLLTSATEIDIPVVVVEGDATASNVKAGSIVAGNVNFNANNFLDLKVAVSPHVNAQNGSVDVFALTLGFGGLNDTGALATAIAPGAHSLMASQVGTFRQRMGVFSQLGDSDKGAWVRVFGDKGTITPDAQLDNLPASNNFAFDQTNQGVEAGVNALVTDGFYLGASLSKSRGKQDLANGFGDDDIDGTTVGGYVTWLGQNGMYADVSYRWMHFEADMTSFGGHREVGGDAGAFNAELGWNVWTSAGGMKLVPQVQYTRTKVENIDRIEGDLADFVSDGGTSSRARLGLEMEQTFQSASGTKWTPYGVLSLVREFDGETGFTVADTFTGRTSTEGTSGQVEFGVNAKIGQRVDVWGGLNYMDGGAIDGVWGGQVGVRYTW